MDVIYFDNHILVVNKPAGLATQPSVDTKDSLEEQAKLWIKKKFLKPHGVFLHAVHRIDKPVSGLVLFARTSKALSRLNDAMREKKMQKKYLAVVEGSMGIDRATLEHYLIHGERRALLADASKKDAKLCRLHFSLLQKEKDYSFVEIDLETGRYHQIRAQMSLIGHPIAGDVKYGARTSPLGEKKITLHQAEMSFPHPITGERITFHAALPWQFFSFVS